MTALSARAAAVDRDALERSALEAAVARLDPLRDAGLEAAPDVRAAAALLQSAESTVIACHVNPDGDALGSALALALALESDGIEARVSFGGTDGVGIPDSLAFLPGLHLIADPGEVISGPAPDLLVTMDTGSADRLGPLRPLLDAAANSLVVDHHTSNTRFGSHLLLDVDAASTTVIVARLIDALGLPLTAEVATCLYVGLVTDTGRFQFSSTTASVHTLAARLLAAGVEPEPIGRRLFATSTFAAVSLAGLALSRAVLEPGLVWTWVTAAERAAAGVPLADVEGIIDALRVSAEAEVAVVLKGIGQEAGAEPVWMASTRSRGAVDVSRACVSLGGGGHRFAAGVTLTGGMAEVMARLRSAFADA